MFYFLQRMLFLHCLSVIVSACFCFYQNWQQMGPPEYLPGLSDAVGAGFISGNISQLISSTDINADRFVDMPPQDDTGSLGLSKTIRADQKRFFFDLGSNYRGHFLRISEVYMPTYPCPNRLLNHETTSCSYIRSCFCFFMNYFRCLEQIVRP